MKTFAAFVAVFALASAEVAKVPLVHPKDVKAGSMYCSMCPFAVNVLKFLLEHSPGIEHGLDAIGRKICQLLPLNTQMEQQCINVMDTVLPKILNSIISGVPSDKICQELMGCPASLVASSYAGATTRANWFECEGCQVIGQFLQHELAQPSFQQEIISAVKKVCVILPTSLEDDCTSGIDNNAQAIFQALIQVLNPDSLCPELGLCDSAVKEQVAAMIKKQKMDKSGLGCEACEWAVNEVKQLLQSSGVLNKLLALMQQVCNVLPGSIQQSCNTIVQQYGPQIIQQILNFLTPQVACADFGLCASPQGKSAMGCDFCKLAFTQIDAALESQKAGLVSALNKLCSMLPTELQGQCTDMVNGFGAAAIDYVINLLDPATICNELNACTAKSVRPQFNAPMPANKDMCSTCQALATQVQNYLKNNEQTVLNGLDAVCDQMGLMANMCKNMVSQYGKPVLDMLIAQLGPSTVCPALHLC